MIAIVALLVVANPDDARLHAAVLEAIRDEIAFGIEATIDKDIVRYMETVPADYRIAEDDGTITDRDALRAKQLQAWSIIPRTNALEIHVLDLKVGCDGQCAQVKTDQRWDRQMIGRDGVTEFNIVTTQLHDERWEVRDGRWIQVAIEELGGTTTVDGKPY